MKETYFNSITCEKECIPTTESKIPIAKPFDEAVVEEKEILEEDNIIVNTIIEVLSGEKTVEDNKNGFKCIRDCIYINRDMALILHDKLLTILQTLSGGGVNREN